jgi:hypothetical protein
MSITGRKYVPFALILILWLLFNPLATYGQEHTLKSSKLIFFYSPGCHNCFRVAKEITHLTGAGFKNNIKIEYLNVDIIENYKLLLSLEELYQSKIRNILPVVYLKGYFINGRGDIKKNLGKLLNMPATAITGDDSKTLPKIDLVKRFNNFTMPAIIAVGLIDGVNPCAITVIVFFMSFLAFQGYRKREIVVIGLVFILSVYLTYCLIGLGIFESLYRLQGFWILTKIVNITVGIISIIFSIYALYDFIQYRRTGSTDNLVLSLPRWIKNLIHRIIGSHYRGGSKAITGLVISALITGFLVSILEAVCVAKIYLPTIVFVLKTTGLKLKALTYLLLYNLLFIVPLLIIFAFAITGTSAGQFQKVLRGHLGIVKVLMGVVFLVLGIFLIWKA